MGVDPQEPFAGHRALWNEVWSSLRFDDELRPLVDSSYRTWLKRLTDLVEEGRRDGSIDAAVEARHRLAAGGCRRRHRLDALPAAARLGEGAELLFSSIRRELAG